MGQEDLQLLIKGIVFSLRQQKLLTKAESTLLFLLIIRMHIKIESYTYIGMT